MTGGHDHCCRLEAVAGHAGPVVLGGGLVVDPQGEPGLGQSDGGIVPLVIAVHRGRNSAPISGFDLSHDIIFIIGNDYQCRQCCLLLAARRVTHARLPSTFTGLWWRRCHPTVSGGVLSPRRDHRRDDVISFVLVVPGRGLR